MKYISTLAHVYSEEKKQIVKATLLKLGYVINSEFSTYQNYSSRYGTIGVWVIVHNKTGMAIGNVKRRIDALKVLAQYNIALFDQAIVNDHGFIEWNDRSAKEELHATWYAMRESGLIVL